MKYREDLYFDPAWGETESVQYQDLELKYKVYKDIVYVSDP